jgi:hypothetical protein
MAKKKKRKKLASRVKKDKDEALAEELSTRFSIDYDRAVAVVRRYGLDREKCTAAVRTYLAIKSLGIGS